MTTVYIAVGSNLSDPVAQANNAINALKQLPKSEFIRSSLLYTSTPMGPQDQPDYINAVVKIQTQLTPTQLLNCTQAIELEQGRVRKDDRWGPRTLDLDFILYGHEVINSERLTIPHYGMKQREFVLYPLAEIAPCITLPCGTRLDDLLSVVSKNGLRVWQS